MRLRRRGLTLIEVLMAVVLLALLAGLAAEGLRASLRALRPAETHADIARFGAAVDTIFEKHPKRVSGLAPGDRTELETDASSGWSEPIEVLRLECAECPPGLGHFEVRSAEFAISRFARASPVPAGGAP